MKAAMFIGGATLALVAGAILGTTGTGHEGCVSQAAVVPLFDPMVLIGGGAVQEPWLDPMVFFSDKAYVIDAVPGTEAGIAHAAFAGGRDSLVSYLKHNILPHVRPGIGWLKPPVVGSTLNEDGHATAVALTSTSGNAALDARLVRVVEKMPHWNPARDADGKAIRESFEFRVVQAGCGGPQQTPPTLKVSMYDVPLTDRNAALEHPYDIGFRLEKTGADTYALITTVELHGGSFYVSPHARGDFKGKFRVEVAHNDHVSLADDFIEDPRSTPVIDLHPFIEGEVNWVNVDTRYEHRLTISSTDDFEVGGKYLFVIEPKCTLEQVPFLIRQRSGVLTIEKWKC